MQAAYPSPESTGRPSSVSLAEASCFRLQRGLVERRRWSLLPHNKARSLGPGLLSAQPWCRPEGVGRSCASFLLGNRRDRCQIRVFSVVVGAAGAGTWGQGSIGTFRWVRGT
jgi:hypothetical protein